MRIPLLQKIRIGQLCIRSDPQVKYTVARLDAGQLYKLGVNPSARPERDARCHPSQHATRIEVIDGIGRHASSPVASGPRASERDLRKQISVVAGFPYSLPTRN